MAGRYLKYDDNKLFVGNLLDTTTSDDLDTLFSKFGKITNIWVARKPPGFAFVTFDDPRDAKYALHELNGKDFKGNSLRIERCRERPSKTKHIKDPYYRPPSRRRRSRTRSTSVARRYRSRSPSYSRVRSKS